jgi:multidrug resistance efflux pump
MNPAHLPKPHEAKQLCRLRALRVQRARERCAEAHALVEQATEAVRERERQIERLQRELAEFQEARTHQLAPHLPRWGTMVDAHRDKLVDRLERAESGLVSDEQELEQAQERLQEARAELTRALARQDAVQGVATETRRHRERTREARGDLELEDLRCGSAGGHP